MLKKMSGVNEYGTDTSYLNAVCKSVTGNLLFVLSKL